MAWSCSASLARVKRTRFKGGRSGAVGASESLRRFRCSGDSGVSRRRERRCIVKTVVVSEGEAGVILVLGGRLNRRKVGSAINGEGDSRVHWHDASLKLGKSHFVAAYQAQFMCGI